MSVSESVILVCAGADILLAADSKHPLLELCMTIQHSDTLQIQQSGIPCAYFGLRDPGRGCTQLAAESLAEQIVLLCQTQHLQGIFADLESNTPAVRHFCQLLDTYLHTADFTLFVPDTRADDVQHAVITLQTAISGGSLAQRLTQAQQRFGSSRVAVLLEPVSADFCLPSQSPDGTPISRQEREQLLQDYHTQVFFSRELCAKYFTYMDAQERGHFVLFDDASTLDAKLALLDQFQIRHRFAIYPDVAPLLKQS